MVWTYLRSCYSFKMRVYIGGVERTFPARWYFCSPGAKRFPFAHGAEASVWLKNAEVNQAWGEVTPYPTDPTADAIRGIDRGLNPGYPGVCYKGDPQWFVDGMLPAHVLDGPPPPFDQCCMPGQAKASGGLLLRGTAVASARSNDPCVFCRMGLGQQHYTLTATGGTQDYAPLNGVFVLTKDSACLWFSNPFPHTYPLWALQCTSQLGWEFAGNPTLPITVADWQVDQPQWDCTPPLHSTNLGFTNLQGTPCTIVLT
jgi:hypothetical protein